MSSLRIEKVNGHIQEELGKLFLSETHLKTGVIVTIAKVRATPNLKEARVAISVFPESEAGYALKSLEKELYRIQKLLNARLHMRPIPRIILEYDATEQNAQTVEELLIRIKKEDERPL